MSHRVHRQFLSWDRPLLPQAVDCLAQGWTGDEALDLSSLLVLVPTRQSGRRLREALAGHAAIKGQAVFPPRVLSLDALVTGEADEAEATRTESLLAWTQVFQEIELEEFRAVFPVDPPARNFTWAMRLAQEFGHLQNTLAEVGLLLADVPSRVGPEFPELERWRQIAGLERRQMEKLAGLDRRDPQTAKIERARTAALPEGIERIVVIATPDPRPVALGILARHAEQVPVDVLVFALETEATAFDEWGRPQVEAWTHRTLVLEDFEQQVQLCPDPEAQAARVVEAAQGYAGMDGMLGVGVVDPEILAPLESALRQAGLTGYNPEGRNRRGDRLYQLLAALAELTRSEAFATVATLARHPDILAYLQARGGGKFSAAGFLQALDKLHAEHLPPDLSAALRHGKGGGELRIIRQLRERLLAGSFPENVAGVLAEIFGARRLDLGREADTALAEAAEVWAGIMREVARAAECFPGLAPAEGWEVALRLYGESVRFAEKTAGAVELQGWLELMWEDAPHLIVAGLNDGRVPDAVVGDPFLPEGLRVRLGLKTNAARLACDAYYLQALAASRRYGGRLDVLLGKTSAVGDPLRPSRLLLSCADAELPRRVGFLFRNVAAEGANLPWTRAWKLRLPRVDVPSRIAVTALRAWLDCPLRFYLARVMRMEAVDPAKAELDALDFGTLCHAALEAMGNEAALRDCTDAHRLREFLLAALEAVATAKYGRELTLPLIVQMESARQRLAFAAEVQAQTRAEGWVIERVEWPFEVAVGGLAIRGKIDRIDRHEASGAIRVLDYKTSDSPVNPAQAHLRNLRSGEARPEWAVIANGGRPQTWADLQLPLYERVATAEFAGHEVVCGYFNLPKAATETAIAPWEYYSRELAAAAWRCAEGVAGAITSRQFLPPREMRGREEEWDDFATLFHHGAADSVEWDESADGAGPEVPA